MQNVFAMDEGVDLLMATGFRKAISLLTLEDRPNVVSALLDYHLMGKVKAEMDQLIEGLNTSGFLDALKRNPVLFEPFFRHTENKLTPG